jgi:hypothetical protein
MNTITVSATISAFFILIKLLAHYKEDKRPDLSDVVYVFLSCVFGISVLEHYSTAVLTKSVEVFTELP